MAKKLTSKALAGAIGATFISTLAATPIAQAGENPFSVNPLTSGYQVADKEGTCGGNKAKEKKDGNCGGKKAMEKKDGNCGSKKAQEMKAKKDGSCGEAKCGGKKK